MALETKEKMLITELAAAPSQTTRIHTSMHARMHKCASLTRRLVESGTGCSRDEVSLSSLRPPSNSVSFLVQNLSTQNTIYLK